MSALFHCLNGDARALHPVHQAAGLHWQLARIHPFVDGNGRAARLAMNLVLLRQGYLLTIIRAERNQRRDYYQALAEADASEAPEPFRSFIEARVLESFNRYLDILNEVQEAEV